jgi:tRNA-modifying protein YgfZ
MSGKPHTAPVAIPGRFRLPGMGALRLHGPDAADFLQRQSMNDVRELDAIGSWHFNGLLSARGRVLALFVALRAAEDGFLLLLADGDAPHWSAHLQRLVFRSKLSLEAAVEVAAIGEFGALTAPGAGPGAAQAQAVGPSPIRRRARNEAGGWSLDFGSAGRERRLWVGTGEHGIIEEVGQPAGDGTAGPAAWQFENLLHGLPRLPAAQRDRYTPQMLGLERLAAFSVKKGCYPGQEIVARTHFLGQARRRLALLGSPRSLRGEETVHCGEHQAAVLDYASMAATHIGVAVLPFSDTPVTCRLDDGAEAIQLPFLDGLARRPE